MSRRVQVSTLIVGGTAAYGLDVTRWQPQAPPFCLDTPFGPSPAITLLRPWPQAPAVAFCSRHGQDALKHSAAFLNPRALVWAAHMLGVRNILSWNGVGAISNQLAVGDLLVPHDLLDWTHARVASFGRERLTTATSPSFAPAARTAILAAIHDIKQVSGENIHAQGHYICTEGPRLETKAEIELFHQLGADVVGMTLVPELFLAQELKIGYASLCYITNFATGRASGRKQKRQFGPAVAHTCLPILLRAAQKLPRGPKPGTSAT